MAKNKNTLVYEKVNGWEQVTAGDEKKIRSFSEDYKGFISAAKTERLCHDIGVDLAKKKGYSDLEDYIASGKKLKAGDKVYYSVAGKTLILAHMGKESLEDGLRVIGGHTDSPRLDLKPRPLYEDSDMVLFDTHYYGGIRKYQWVAIPLALYGVIITADGKKVNIAIGDDPSDPIFTITDLLPHLAKDQSKKTMAYGITG